MQFILLGNQSLLEGTVPTVGFKMDIAGFEARTPPVFADISIFFLEFLSEHGIQFQVLDFLRLRDVVVGPDMLVDVVFRLAEGLLDLKVGGAR